MLQGIQLLRRITPTKVDGRFLRSHKVAPGNEYKVIGALKFLALIDEYGRPTEKSRLLRTRGASALLELQNTVQSAYQNLIAHLKEKGITLENTYNYFVTQENLGAEMAAKAARFFLGLCQMAQMDLVAELSPPRARRTKEAVRGPRTPSKGNRPYSTSREDVMPDISFQTPPLLLAITPELADMDQERLTELFRKMRKALERASED